MLRPSIQRSLQLGQGCSSRVQTAEESHLRPTLADLRLSNCRRCLSLLPVTCMSTEYSWCAVSWRSTTSACSPYALSTEMEFVWCTSHFFESLGSRNTLITLFWGFRRQTSKTISRVLSSAAPQPTGLPMPLVPTRFGGLGLLCSIHSSRALATRSMPVSRVQLNTERCHLLLQGQCAFYLLRN